MTQTLAQPCAPCDLSLYPPPPAHPPGPSTHRRYSQNESRRVAVMRWNGVKGQNSVSGVGKEWKRGRISQCEWIRAALLPPRREQHGGVLVIGRIREMPEWLLLAVCRRVVFGSSLVRGIRWKKKNKSNRVLAGSCITERCSLISHSSLSFLWYFNKSFFLNSL